MCADTVMASFSWEREGKVKSISLLFLQQTGEFPFIIKQYCQKLCKKLRLTHVRSQTSLWEISRKLLCLTGKLVLESEAHLPNEEYSFHISSLMKSQLFPKSILFLKVAPGACLLHCQVWILFIHSSPQTCNMTFYILTHIKSLHDPGEVVLCGET